ncbi:MAG TPA: methyltransferase domain-containing protein, partial [Myxococcota bacterium]|nr:methyltransferase domain-containing protein [Myxococcota bacterium]
ARMLAYPGLCRRLLDLGLGYVYQSLAGPDAASHDAAVRARGAFSESLRTLANLRATRVERTVNVVVTRQNVARLDEFPPLLAPLAPLRVKFSLIEPEGNALDGFARLVPTWKESAARVAHAILRARDYPDLTVAFDGCPLCLLPGLEDLDAGLRADGFAWMAEAFETCFHPVDDRNRGFGGRCAGCSLRRRCRGGFLTYLARRGERELRPVSRQAPNSFNLSPVGPPEALRLSACAIRKGRRPPPDPIHACLVMRAPGTAQRHVVRGRDFSDRTLERTLREEPQVYLDLARGLVPEDFAGQLRRLVPASTCIRCPRRPLCGGCLRPDARDGFSRARRLLDVWLHQVRGHVLDVGCGQVPIQGALARALEAGALDYLGLDPGLPPDAPGLAGFSRRRTRFEAWRWSGRPFDWVLSLRSLNHLRSPSRAITRMASMLAPHGGRLLLAEDVLFGLVRSAQKTQAVEDHPGLPFEHLHDLDVAEVEAWGREAGLRTLEKFDAQELGCTLWILVMERCGRQR